MGPARLDEAVAVAPAAKFAVRRPSGRRRSPAPRCSPDMAARRARGSAPFVFWGLFFLEGPSRLGSEGFRSATAETGVTSS